jgi:hypothetical protein
MVAGSAAASPRHANVMIHVLHTQSSMIQCDHERRNSEGVLAHGWLLLIHQLPAQPAYLRVKIWRRLQGIGAIAVKNAVHALPMNEETQEDFEWLLREIREGGGEAFVCEARLIDGLSARLCVGAQRLRKGSARRMSSACSGPASVRSGARCRLKFSLVVVPKVRVSR